MSLVKLGAEKIVEAYKGRIKNKDVGILASRASIDSTGKHSINILCENGFNVIAIFGPEHGFDTQAEYMKGVSNSKWEFEGNRIPVYSLYGSNYESLKPSLKMFDGLDYLIVDIQDIGSRYYTYIYTMAFCMQTAAKTGTKIIVSDRPNPINGIDIEGNLIESGFESFVGLYPLPVRHGMTIGELARYFNKEFGINCDLEIIQMDGWKREWYWDNCEIHWINPSPNMQSLTEALLYPGMCLLEGTNVSEGRGTETPFEICGAPFINGEKLAEKITAENLPGISFHPISFTPSKDKWAGKKCSGVVLKIEDREIFRPNLTGITLIYILSLQNPGEFKWRTEEYEFRADVPAIDLLTGSSKFRKVVDKKQKPDTFIKSLTKTPESFLKTRAKYLLY